MRKNSYKWATGGDVNAFFGLVLDNLAGLILALTLLSRVFQFPVNFAIRYMVPGTAIGVLVGDLLYFFLAFWVARRTNRSDVTAMPLGLDTPSLIGMVFFVLGPAFVAAKASGLDELAAATQAWHIGICAVVLTGMIKLVFAFGSNWIRHTFPRAGLLGSLAGIALVLIAFLQIPKIFEMPLVGLPAMIIIFISLIGRVRMPFGIPGALASVCVGCLIWYIVIFVEKLLAGANPFLLSPDLKGAIWFPIEWLDAFTFEWFGALNKALVYLPYIIPFAIATVIGGIDCTESAAAAGDEYHTGWIIGIESVATIAAGLCGGVIQTTPYIGQPAYKAMGARAAYTLATALFVGSAGVVGYFNILFEWIPEAAVLPILVFIGLEITSQSFHATPKRHYAALALACLPAMAKLAMILLPTYVEYSRMQTDHGIGILRILSGGFIITSLIWASSLAQIIDRRFNFAAIYFVVAAVLVMFGVIHSPLDGEKMFSPKDLFSAEMQSHQKIVLQIAGSYLVMAGLVWMMELTKGPDDKLITSDEEYEDLA